MKKVLYSVLVLLLLSGCDSTPAKKLDTVSSGSIVMAVDETLQPLIEAQLDVFHVTYPQTNIITNYVSELDAINAVMIDSARIAVTTRPFNEQEKQVFKAAKIEPKSVKVAWDAVALIVHPNQKATNFTIEQVKGVISGKITKWNQIDPSAGNDDIQIVFDNKSSSTVTYLTQFSGGLTTKNVFALNTNPQVIEYVGNSKNSLGIIGLNWISDRDDTVANNFLSKINVVAISSDADDEGSGRYYRPYQAYIADGSYPLTRSVYIISREARTGLGTGFVSFVTSYRGQLVVKQSGLLPATIDVRFKTIQLSN